jgi:SET domain-containing protein
MDKFSDIYPEKINVKESEYLYIQESGIPNSGKGLYVSIDIYKNEIIALYKGKILTAKEAKEKAKNGLDDYFINMIDGATMDSINTKCYAKYANDAEGIVKTNFTNNAHITLSEEDKVCLVAIRAIKAGEEVFCSYGKKYWKKRNSIKNN